MFYTKSKCKNRLNIIIIILQKQNLYVTYPSGCCIMAMSNSTAKPAAICDKPGRLTVHC